LYHLLFLSRTCTPEDVAVCFGEQTNTKACLSLVGSFCPFVLCFAILRSSPACVRPVIDLSILYATIATQLIHMCVRLLFGCLQYCGLYVQSDESISSQASRRSSSPIQNRVACMCNEKFKHYHIGTSLYGMRGPTYHP